NSGQTAPLNSSPKDGLKHFSPAASGFPQVKIASSAHCVFVIANRRATSVVSSVFNNPTPTLIQKREWPRVMGLSC
ncbi:MAG: hypothetical protein Q8P67_00720, partial [archaeon]|nr:hypothetical protein [archaeon]